LSGCKDGEGRHRKGRRSRKREQIRRAAYLCFRDSGYHDTTVDAICQRSQISKGSFYWHYSSKQDVFIDVLETWAREVIDELYDQFEEAMSQEDYLLPLTSALEREIHRGRALVPLWLEFTVYARRDREVQETLSKFYRRARLAITEILRPALEHRFSEHEMQSISATIFGAYTGLMIQDLSDPTRANARQMVRNFMGVIEWWLRQVREDTAGVPPQRGRPRAAQGGRVTERELEDYLKPLPEPGAQRLGELRKLLLDTVPELDERVIVGWKVLAYEGNNGLVAYLKGRGDCVHLGFYHGAHLPDALGLLQGTGKQRRHMVIPLHGELDRDAIKDLLEAAVTFQRI
jgi:AcrR family transcriptional regulator